MMRYLAPFIALAMLAGCKSQLTAEIYMSDVLTASNGETLSIPILFENEAAGEENCREYGPKLAAAFSRGFSDVEFIGCVEEGYTNLIQIRARTTIEFTPDWEEFDPDHAIRVTVAKSDGRRLIAFNSNVKLIEAIRNSVPMEAAMISSEFDGPVLRAELVNDLREDVSAHFEYAYVNNEPIIFAGPRTLRGRDKITIELSNVASDTLAETSRTAVIFWMPDPE